MILTDEVRETFRRWDINPDDPEEMDYWTGACQSQGDVHTALVEAETMNFQGSDEELYRYLCDADAQIREDARLIWQWIADDCELDDGTAPLSRVWDGEAFREL